jgi:hypothetical protein
MHEAATVLYGRDSDKVAALRRGARSFARLGAKVVKRG